MTAPYAPSQLTLANFDATASATAIWVFSSSDATVGQQSFEVKIYNNTTGALVLDTGVINSAQSQYTIPANTLVNRTVYKWQVQYTDTAGNASPWSTSQIFTCSSLPTTSITNPTSNQTIGDNSFTVSCNYAQSQSVSEQSWRIVLYASDKTTVVQDTGINLSTANQHTFYAVPNGTYYVQSTVTSGDGLVTQSAMISFTLSYAGSGSTPTITATPLPSSASIRIDWANDRKIYGTYVSPNGSSPTYKTGKFNQAIDIAAYGEKVYWKFNGINQFRYTSWFLPDEASTSWTTNQVIVNLQSDSHNYVQVRYDPSDNTFVFEKVVSGKGMTAKSQTGLTFAAGDQIFVAIQQSTTSTYAYIGIANAWYRIGLGGVPDANGTYGVATFGADSFTAKDPGLVTITSAYVGCSPTDGEESYSLMDQTSLSTDIMTETDLQALYTNSTSQTFNTSTSIFLADFDNSLIGGVNDGTSVASWGIYRSYGGTKSLIDNIPYDANVTTVTYTDATPLSNINYTYEIVALDASGNIGYSQSVYSSVSFDGWWLLDKATGASFQFLYMVSDVAAKQNYGRVQYTTFGKYPIIGYSPTKYYTGTLTGWVVNRGTSAQQQYQQLQTMIDNHDQILLRGDDSQGMMVDIYDPTNTVPTRTFNQYQIVKISFTEVGEVA